MCVCVCVCVVCLVCVCIFVVVVDPTLLLDSVTLKQCPFAIRFVAITCIHVHALCYVFGDFSVPFSLIR